MSATGVRSRVEPRPDDLFALGFLARGAVVRDGKDARELPIAAVETVSTAFMGLTVGCAKCHDHMYDPITQTRLLRHEGAVRSAGAQEGDAGHPGGDLSPTARRSTRRQKRRGAVEAPINALIAPYKQKLYDDRVAMLPADVQAVIRKPEKERTAAEQKIADDYFPVLRIDADKIMEVMPEAERKKYQELQRQARPGRAAAGAVGAPAGVLDRGSRPRRRSWRRATSSPAATPSGRRRTTRSSPAGPSRRRDRLPRRPGRSFSDWLTAPENPLFARVAVNRLWQWHFGEGLQKTPSDFGKLGGTPSQPAAARLAGVGVRRARFSMKEMHRLIVTSDDVQAGLGGRPGARRGRIARPIRTTPTSGTSACSGWKPSRSGIRSSPRPATST